EKKLAEKFNVFLQQLNVLKDRLEKGTPQDQEYAKVLEKVIDRTKNKSIDVQFQEMVEFLQKNKLSGLKDTKEAVDKSKALTQELQDLLNLLRQDKSLAELKSQQEQLKAILAKVEEIIAQQKFIQAKTQNSQFDKTDPNNLQGDQKNVSDKT